MFHGCWCDLRCDHLVRPTCRESVLEYSELSVRCKRCHLLLFFQVAQGIEGNNVNMPLLKIILRIIMVELAEIFQGTSGEGQAAFPD